MKRRSKLKRRRACRAKFTFAQLEPRKLLAAHGLFSASMGADFIGPLYVETIEQTCIVQSGTQSEAVLGSKVAEANEVLSDSEGKVQSESCSDVQAEDVVEWRDIDADLFLSVDLSDGQSLTFSGYDSRATTFDELRGNGTAGDALQEPVGTAANTYRFAPGDGLNFYEASTVVVFRNELAETAPLENPIELESDDGIYFKETQSDSGTETRKVSEPAAESSANVGMLAQRQLFALISPAEIDRVELSASSSTTKFVEPGSSLHSLATPARSSSISPVQSSDFGQSNSLSEKSQALPSLSLKTPLSFSARSSNNAAPTVSHPMDSFVEQATRAQLPAVVPYSFLDQLFGGRSKSGQQSVDGNRSSKDGKVDESKSDESLARSIQIVESAIILIGLPSSRVCRDDEPGDRSRV